MRKRRLIHFLWSLDYRGNGFVGMCRRDVMLDTYITIAKELKWVIWILWEM